MKAASCDAAGLALNADPSTGRWPSAASAWWAVVVLTLTYLVAFVDRQIVSLLVAPLKASLQLSDTQIGLLQGLAFGLFYTLLGVPIGRLIDRTHRRNVVAIGCFLWCIATSLSGLAQGFLHLFLARMAVGVGEATVSPGALSLLSDYFPPARRALAISVYIAGASLGAGAALLAGGAILEFIGDLGVVRLPALGVLEPWQLVFISVGTAGLIAVLLLLSVKEPPRRDIGEVDRMPEWSDFFSFLRARVGLFGPYFAGFALCSTVGYGVLAWAPTFLMRAHGWTAAEAGVGLGIVVSIFGAGGVLLGGLIATWRRSRGVADATLRTAAWGVAALCVPATIAPLLGSAQLSILLFGAAIFCVTFASGVSATALQEVTPNRMRAQTSAVYFFAINFIGVGLGPLHVALVTDYVFGDETRIAQSMALSAAILGPVAAYLMYRAVGRFRRWQI